MRIWWRWPAEPATISETEPHRRPQSVARGRRPPAPVSPIVDAGAFVTGSIRRPRAVDPSQRKLICSCWLARHTGPTDDGLDGVRMLGTLFASSRCRRNRPGSLRPLARASGRSASRRGSGARSEGASPGVPVRQATTTQRAPQHRSTSFVQSAVGAAGSASCCGEPLRTHDPAAHGCSVRRRSGFSPSMSPWIHVVQLRSG